MAGRAKHWEQAYESRASSDFSWYVERLSDSLRLIAEVATPESTVIDVGGGTATLVDDLLAQGYSHLTLLDISETAIARTRTRLGEPGANVHFIVADVTSAELPSNAYDVWHDRAAFHFLIEDADRRAYRAGLERALRVGGHVVLGTFSPDGPAECSGLPVARYDAPALQDELGAGFELTKAEQTIHVTPRGAEQAFVICRFKRLDLQ